MTSAAPTSFSGAPNDDPAWLSIGLGRWSFPPVPGFDCAINVETEEALKLDEQKASGKDKAKTKVNGIDNSKGKVTVEWTYRIWAQGRAFMIGISPNGPDKGGPFNCVHPEWNDRGVHSIEVIKVGKLERKPGGRVYSQTFDWSEWTDPGTASAATGTKTPDKADPVGDDDNDSGASTKPKGFGGDSAPSPDYTHTVGGRKGA